MFAIMAQPSNMTESVARDSGGKPMSIAPVSRRETRNAATASPMKIEANSACRTGQWRTDSTVHVCCEMPSMACII
jgi:hypothetical protein